jgi:glycosyltransferase involved in cell wall biosynthesis
VFFSVIICTYNHARFLPDALRTVAAQTFVNFELLIIDDGSTDNTDQVVESFSSQFRKCVYIKKAHTGLADSRNYGVRAAAGTHIAFLDADDLWAPEYLAELSKIYAENPSLELFCGNGYIVDRNGTILRAIFPEHLKPICSVLHTARELIDFYRYSSPSATAFTKSLYGRAGPYEERFSTGHDQTWIIRAVRARAICGRTTRPLFLYRLHGDNMILKSSVEGMFEEELSQYQLLIDGYGVDPDTQALCRKFMRPWIIRVMMQYPGDESRRLLRRYLATVGPDPFFRAAYLLTYLGGCRLLKREKLLKNAKGIKRAILEISRPEAQKIDFQAPPDIMFATLQRTASKVSANNS